MSREVIVSPLGLITRPNIYGQFPVGALLTAQNLVMRAPGIIESAPATVLGVSFGASNDVVHDLFALDGGHMSMISRSGGGTWTPRVDGTASTFSAPISVAPTFSQTGRISTVRARDRVFFNTQDQGVLVMDSTSPTPPAALRRGGLPQSSIFLNQMISTNAVSLPNNSAVAYASVMRRVLTDGYQLVSKPSPILIVVNLLGAARNPEIPVGCFSGDGWIAGDILELYRTDIVSGATQATDPGTTLKKIYSRTLTSADVAGAQIAIEDTTQPGPLGVTDGEALYTNPGQKGLLGGHRQPDICNCMAVFKNFLFCGDLTERPQLVFQVPGGFMDTRFAGYDTAAFRLNGIGVRVCVGTVTIGTATITGVSAAHMVGVKQGQILDGGGGGAIFPGGTKVLSAVGTTITATNNATASGTAVILQDVLEVIGFEYFMGGNSQSFVQTTSSREFLEITCSLGALGTENPAGGITMPTWILEPVVPKTAQAFTVRATNGQNYRAQLNEITTTAATLPYVRTRNLLKWSNDSQPEHFPAPNEAQIGTGAIIQLVATRDALWIFCTDGLFRLSGAGGQWRVDTMDTTLVLASPRAAIALRETVYAYCNQGFVRISDAGVEPLSEKVIGDLLPGAEYTETASIIVGVHEAEEEVIIRIDATQVFVYSVRTGAFTTVLVPDVTAMSYARYPVSGLPAIAFGRSPSGSAPRYELWNATTSFLAPTARFHPVFAQDPLASKQWIDGTFIFDVGSIAKSLTPAWNGTPSPASLLKGGAQFFNESRATFGVPRRAAIGHTMAPGWSFGALSTATKMYALSVRYKQLSEQNLHR